MMLKGIPGITWSAGELKLNQNRNDLSR